MLTVGKHACIIWILSDAQVTNGSSAVTCDGMHIVYRYQKLFHWVKNNVVKVLYRYRNTSLSFSVDILDVISCLFLHFWGGEGEGHAKTIWMNHVPLYLKKVWAKKLSPLDFLSVENSFIVNILHGNMKKLTGSWLNREFKEEYWTSNSVFVQYLAITFFPAFSVFWYLKRAFWRIFFSFQVYLYYFIYCHHLNDLS